jgi:hypothetical protein
MLEKFSSLGIQVAEIGAGGYTPGEADAVIGREAQGTNVARITRQYRGIRDSSSLYLITMRYSLRRASSLNSIDGCTHDPTSIDMAKEAFGSTENRQNQLAWPSPAS